MLICTIGSKLILWLYCRRVTNSGAVMALANDHRNDVFSNTMAIATALIANRL